MIASLQGKLDRRGDDYIIVDVGGVGFKVKVPTRMLETVGEEGEPVKVYTHLHVRENELALYGCATAEELALFEQLLTVNGVGPKMALTILSRVAPETLRAAIAQGQVEVLSQVPGIGKKLAQRLVLDLKGKIDLTGIAELPPLSFAESEVLTALTGLGYSLAEAQAAVRSLPHDSSLTMEDKILLALRYFGSQGQ